MLTTFIQAKLARAKYAILKDRSYFGEIPGVRGVWANSKTLEACRKELQEVLEDWVLVKVRMGDKVPGLNFSFDRRKEFAHA